MIISLADKQLELKQELIEYLEEALALAREGKITNFVGGYTDSELGILTFSSYNRFLVALGLCETVKLDVIKSAEED